MMDISTATILIVDDEPDLIEIYQAWAERKGAKVMTAPNGLVALKLLAENAVDVMISDVRMPVMDGISLVRKLRQRDQPVPSIMFVSGFSDIDSREAYDLGVEAILSKPTARGEFIGTVETILCARDKMWSTATGSHADCQIREEFDSLEDALLHEEFAIGRGGCRVNAVPIQKGGLIDLSLTFRKESLTLKGQGIIRWCDLIRKRTGIELCYLAPESRTWFASHISDDAPRSFIPG